MVAPVSAMLLMNEGVNGTREVNMSYLLEHAGNNVIVLFCFVLFCCGW